MSEWPTRRVLITGSRTWTDYQMFCIALDAELRDWLNMGQPAAILVHGDCPTGADAMVKRYIANRKDRHYVDEPHPANWNLGKKAGPLRNQKMVDLGADRCLAFKVDPWSRGTEDCIRRARGAGIPVTLYTPNGLAK